MAKRSRPRAARPGPDPPGAFRVDRRPGIGSHPLLKVFPGLDRVPGFSLLSPSASARLRLAREAVIEVVPQPLWMYVAPHEVPEAMRRRGFTPFTTPKDCIVVGRRHLARSATSVLYLDILHELRHLLQRRRGAELWAEGYGYADRPTEIDAYRLGVRLAREMNASEAFLRRYLKVSWIGVREYRTLLRNVGVAVAPSRRPVPRRAGRPSPASLRSRSRVASRRSR
ncbi:MAG TPA: hypothetical protein VGV64_02970 [Thermoplasmata archaeon]|nr:hypothetical protein [Thermoplasmata archaeon]HEV2428793.1 hypothetical protein [Thermoplasmata archaeon]